MTDARQHIDLEGFLRQHVHIRNDHGGRGYDRGVRIFDCPLCDDKRGRGWMNVALWSTGCFNAGCFAEPKLEGGAVEWTRRVKRLATRTEAWSWLRTVWGTSAPLKPPAPTPRGDDFCHMPPEARVFSASATPLSALPLEKTFLWFVLRQWGLTPGDARTWELRYVVQGRYSQRVIVPIRMGGQLVGFQARTIMEREPKYLTSEYGTECGRLAAEMLFNLDGVADENEILLVEGAGDVMGWHRQAQGGAGRRPTAVGLLGVALTPGKLALLAEKRPERVVVALDAEPAAQQRTLQHLEDLGAWGMTAALGHWRGGKDAGAGATLEVVEPDSSLSAAVRARLGR